MTEVGSNYVRDFGKNLFLESRRYTLSKNLFFVIFFFYVAGSISLSAQETTTEKYWVFFKDKQVQGLRSGARGRLCKTVSRPPG